MNDMVTCPHCSGDGYTGQDEDGNWYACYACGTTGFMSAEVVAAERRDRAWFAYVAAEAEIKKRIRLGVPPGWIYYFDANDGWVMHPPPAGKVCAPCAQPAIDIDEDVPY